MHRSSSTSRASEEFFAHLPSPSPSSKGSQSSGRAAENDELPTYDPLSEAAKKERSRIRFAENAVHIIPFVLVLCAVILWFCSSPAVNLGNKDDSVLARIKGLTIEGNVDNSNGLTGLPNTLEAGDLDQPDRLSDSKTGKFARRESE